MKNLFKNIAIFFVVFSFAACSNDDVDFAPKSLEVTPHNISGYWMLTEHNGQKIPQGLFCYVEYIRKDRKFVMYQKFDSMYPRRITGVFSIENNKYFVTELLESSMILTADSENAEISKYIRCNEIPEDIIESAK